MPDLLSRRDVLGLTGLGLSGLALAAGFGDRWARATAAPLQPPRGDVRLALISDLNGPYGTTSYIAEVQRAIALLPSLRPDLVLCAGDMIAGQKAGLGASRLAAMWESFDRQILVPLQRAGLPFAPVIGNHDGSSLRLQGGYQFAEDRSEAERFWRRRRSSLGLRFVEASGFPFHYSFRQNDIFFLVWDASSAVVPAEQLRWAERNLEAPVARDARRRIVLGHLPLQAVARGRDTAGNVLSSAAELRQLLERHDVQTYVSGHHHAYYPSRLGRLELLHLGASGSGPRPLLGGSAPPFQTLTLLDLFWKTGRSVDTTVNLRTLQRVELESLPRSLTDAAGRRLPRRDTT